MKTVKMKIDSIIYVNCNLLQIPIPTVAVVEASEFPTLTTRAAIEWNGKDAEGARLLINQDFLPLFKADSSQAWLTISHELRHLWQIRKKEDGFYGYKESSEVDVRIYNNQELEIDAWAWCVFVMQRKLGVRPAFEDLFGEVIAEEIINKAKKIKETFKDEY